MSKKKINEGHYLELMDRLHVLSCTFDDHIINHPLSKKDKEIKFQLNYISKKLSDVYQRVGQKDYEKNGTKTEVDPVAKVVLGRREKSKK